MAHKRLEDLRQKALDIARTGKSFLDSATAKMQEVEEKSVRIAGQVAWYPAGALLDIYQLPQLLKLQSAQEVALLQALTAAELGKQVNEPLLGYFIENAQKALPGPTSESTTLVPYGINRRSGAIEFVKTIASTLGTAVVREASDRFEILLPDIISQDENLSAEEKQRLLAQIPLFQTVAQKFVGQVSGDTYQLLTQRDTNTLSNIIKSHARNIGNIIKEYQNN